MPTEPFTERWLKKERECGLPAAPDSMVRSGDLYLPLEAAPCLGFREFAHQPPIWEVFGIPERWSPEERDRLAAYRMIGSDGAGNPVCVEAATGAVWVLDHENRFRSRQFVNSGIPQLAECLLAYMGERDPERFRSVVLTVDSPAIEEGAFWWNEALGIQTHDT